MNLAPHCFLSIPLGAFLAASCLAAQVEPQSPFQISVSVDLVILNPVVQDSKGQFVSDLRREDFEIREEGRTQSISLFRHEDVPVTVGLVIDHSGSMHQKLPDVIAAARTFVKWSNPDDQMFIVNFNERVTLGLPAGQAFSNRAQDLEAAILAAPLTGQTALYDAVALALARLPAAGPTKKVLIVVSDGVDNASSVILTDLLRQAGRSNAVIYAIGIFDDNEPDRNPAALRRLAAGSGGSAWFPDKPSEVIEICRNIAREIRNQYTLGYISSGAAKPGSWRPVRVTAHAAGKGRLSVRARSGYLTLGEPPR